MYLIVGLGNPGPQYERTFHNCGFEAVTAAARLAGAGPVRNKCRALLAEAFVGGEKVIFAKPQTYMNLSGESIREIIAYYGIPLTNVVVIYDDYDLPLGWIRIRAKGTGGSHNGMRNVVALLGTKEVARIRIGIRPENPTMPLLDYVLSSRAKDEQILIPAFNAAAQAALEFAGGTDAEMLAMKYNTVKESAQGG